MGRPGRGRPLRALLAGRRPRAGRRRRPAAGCRWPPNGTGGSPASWRCGCGGPNRTSIPPERIDEPYALLIRGDWAAAAAIWAAGRVDPGRGLICGDADAAAEALRIADGMGAVRVAQRWRADLRRRGVRAAAPPGQPANPAGLTARQLDVLLLLAEG